MVLTVTTAPPHNHVGPGLPLQIATTVTVPTGVHLDISLALTSIPEVAILHQTIPWNYLTPQQNTITLKPSSPIPVNVNIPPVAFSDDNVQGQATLIQGTTTLVDQASFTSVWDNTEGLPQLMSDLTSGISGGLTDQQATALNEIHQSTFPSIALDTITLQELTQGPQGGFVGAQLLNAIFGVIVRIATIPADIILNTPDADYSVASLAVVQIFRGSDIWKRIPIHRTSQIVSLLEENVVGGLPVLLTTQWLLQMSIQVTFRAGVTGQVFLMNFP